MGPAPTALVACLAWGALSCAATPGPEAATLVNTGPALQLVDDPRDPDFATILASGLAPEQLERWKALPEAERQGVLTVFTAGATEDSALPPLMGRVEPSTGALRFRPRFPLQPDLPYRVRFEGERVGAVPLSTRLTLVAPQRAPTTRVTAFLPGTAQVPANLLRVYVQFSAPMHPRDVLTHVRLFDASGQEVEVPFVDLEHGLWDPGCTRLTLFFHPGRVKRDIGEALGPPLGAERAYTLVVEEGLEDARGEPLAARAAWSFRTSAADRASPDPAQWFLEAPARSSDPLRVTFDERLDAALVERLLVVEDAQGVRVPGKGRGVEGSTGFCFEPDLGWSTGDYTLLVHPALEDLAGNAVGHRFEERLGDEHDRTAAEPVRLAFRF